MKPIITTPNDVLMTPAQAVVKIDHKVKKIISEMRETLSKADNPKGVGLAAPQIGVSLRIFLINPQENDPISVYINPTFTWKSDTLVKGIPGKTGKLEGCLSIPKVWGVATRHRSVTLSYLDEAGTTRQQKFTGFPAIIIQHEMDHLDGILFPKRVIEQKGTLYKPVVDENGKEVLEPLEI